MTTCHAGMIDQKFILPGASVNPSRRFGTAQEFQTTYPTLLIATLLFGEIDGYGLDELLQINFTN